MRKNKWISHGTDSDNTSVNIICFPYAGGSASYFATWKKYFSEKGALCPVLYPMREIRMNDAMPDTIQELARQFVTECEELFAKPFLLFSHCTGSTIAYETARYVKKSYDKEPAAFIASSAPSPRYKLVGNDVESLSDEDFISLLKKTQRVDANAEKIPYFKEYYLPIIRADFIIQQKYEMGEPTKLNCPITIMKGTEDELINQQKIEDWKQFTTGSFNSFTFEGNHFYIDSKAEEVSGILNTIANEVQC